MATGPEIRRRQQQVSSTSRPRGDKPKSIGLAAVARTPLAFFIRNLPLILSIQVLFLVLIISDPFGLRRERVAPDSTVASGDGRIKPILGIADVEQLTARVAVNETVIMLILPNGYIDFLNNWMRVTGQHTDLEGRFLVLAEDEATFAKINLTYPDNAIFRMDVRETLSDPSACRTPNTRRLEALQAAYRKVVYSREIMNAGHNVLLCDVTVAWARNPFPHFTAADTYLTLGDIDKAEGEKLLVDFPTNSVYHLQPPLPRGVGKLPPLSDEVVFFQNNVGSWVTLDYWAVVLEAEINRECNSTTKNDQGTDLYLTGLSTDALNAAVKNAVHLSPRPRVGLLPPAKFPPPTIFFDDASWRALVEKDSVVIRTKSGANDKEAMKERLVKAGLWKM